MSTINQIRANRRNAQKSTGPKTPAGKARSRFNALTHGRRADSVVLPGEDPAKFEHLKQSLIKAWRPVDEMEESLVEQIAVNQWKLARLDQSEAAIYAPGALPPGEFALAIHRLCLTQTRLERSISTAIADLERYRKIRAEREKAAAAEGDFRRGLIWAAPDGKPRYEVLPQIRGLDGAWRHIPRETAGDFSTPLPGDPPAPPHTPPPGPNTHA